MTLTPGGRPVRSARTGAKLAAVLIILAGGCAVSPPPGAAVGRTARPGKGTVGPALSGPARRALASRYLAIARPANHRLEHEVDGFAEHRRRRDLTAATADLRAEAATERWFDRRLAAIAFPAAIAVIARALIGANEHRIALTEQEALSATIGSLRSFTAGHRAADAAVEAQVRLIRRALGLPPPSES